MKIETLVELLEKLDEQKRQYVFTTEDLRALFEVSAEITLKKMLSRLVDKGHLVRACRGIYVNEKASSFDIGTVRVDIAAALRRDEFCYVGGAYVLSEASIISQVLPNMEVMTNGRAGKYETAFGSLWFSHVNNSPEDLEGELYERPSSGALMWSKPRLALKDTIKTSPPSIVLLINKEVFDDVCEDVYFEAN